MTLIHEACAGASFQHRNSPIAKKLLCALNALAEHVLLRAKACALPESSGEVVKVQPRNLRQCVQNEAVGKICIDIFSSVLRPGWKSFEGASRQPV